MAYDNWGYKSSLPLSLFTAMKEPESHEWQKINEQAIMGFVKVGEITIWDNSAAKTVNWVATIYAQEYERSYSHGETESDVMLILEPHALMNRADEKMFDAAKQQNMWNSNMYLRFMAVGGISHFKTIYEVDNQLKEYFADFVSKNQLVHKFDKLSYLKGYIFEQKGEYYEYAENSGDGTLKLINIANGSARIERLVEFFADNYSTGRESDDYAYKFIKREVFARKNLLLAKFLS